MKEAQRKLEQAERRFSKRIDTKTKLVPPTPQLCAEGDGVG